ncbi:MAG: hypothetical protein V1904_00065 [Bacteroidota bacterium]
MIKSVTIFLFILLLVSTVVMSQSNISVQDKTDSAAVINNQQQQAVQHNSKTSFVADSTAVGENNEKKQIPLEKQFLDMQKEKQLKKQLQQKNDSLKIQ